jgi:hypothetical protein
MILAGLSNPLVIFLPLRLDIAGKIQKQCAAAGMENSPMGLAFCGVAGYNIVLSEKRRTGDDSNGS